MTKPLLGDRAYNFLKYVAQVVLPAAATLVFALSEVWDFPQGLQIVGTITAVDTFLGLLLGLSTKTYNASGAKYDGALVVEEDGDKKVVRLELDSDPDKLDQKAEVTFRVAT